ncbi:hypothetical protein RTG_02305 [Rhodotorula toruloides ATCC 204091]|uniref:Uncharacterized protein n=1 Tax=Rhodotorula toruloides TaxID=5286 RepID=A0A0K3CED3_RHOTO|nr:hypothetical protein RTG_02305 [Rhodotorula toruloides ATCC 204091]KAK4336465.1 hypothetical protein RTBOTA2_005246 [Rhodotorula toruloides]PRQ74186.1 hypothetical protein AAT19DRAFT_14539 [Rhodotorula toruloides]
MPPLSPSLETLPQPVQQRIVALALQDDPSFTLIALTALGRSLHAATRSVLARSLTLDDDDGVLVAAEEWAEQRREGRGPSQDDGGQVQASGAGAVKGSVLAQVVAKDDWADEVRELVVVRPAVDLSTLPPASSAHQFEQFSFDEDSPASSPGEAESPIPPLNDAALFGLIRRCKNLTSFTWSSYRLPPDDLCQVLGESAKGLLHFKVEIVASPLAGGAGAGEEAGVAAGSFVGSPSSPQLGTSPTASFASHGASSTSHTPPRWDATSLSSLPSTLTSLSISSLSLAGSRTLSTSLAFFPSLESLSLSRTLFVDDAVLSSIGENCKALKRLEVKDMGGTKVGENGLGEVFAGCEALEVLVLDAVEGRFSRSTWSNLAPLPSSLHTLKLLYPESGPHKSWVLDHLSSLSSILTPTGGPGLKRLTVSRKVRPEAVVPGSHHLASNPIDPVLDPSKWVLTASSSEIEAICEDGKRWESLELDLWAMDGGAVKRVLEECAGVRKVKVLLDAPFRNLLTLGSSFAASFALQWFVVSIPPHHTPELSSLDPNEYLSLVGATPSPSTSPTKSPSGEKGDKEDRSTHPVSHLATLTPPTREWRRFLKRSHTLESLTWAGRGGLGTWKFGSKAGSSLLRVEFEPTRPSTGATAGTGAVEVPKSPRSPMGRRRFSILSFGTTPSPTSAVSTLSLSPPSPTQTAQTSPQTSPYTSFGSASREVCSPSTGSARRRSSTSSTASSAFFTTPSHTTGSGSALGLYPIPSPPSTAVGSPSKKSFADALSGSNGTSGGWTMSAGGGVTAAPGWAENGNGTSSRSVPPVEEEQGAEAKGKTSGGGRRRRGSPTTGRKKAGGATNGGSRK